MKTVIEWIDELHKNKEFNNAQSKSFKNVAKRREERKFREFKATHTLLKMHQNWFLNITTRNKKNGINNADAFGQGKCIFTR